MTLNGSVESNFKEYSSQYRSVLEILPEIGINSFFIIKQSGLPFLSRVYSPKGQLSQNNILLGGFFSAITSFAHSHVSSFLSDLCLVDDKTGVSHRIFLKFSPELIYILVYDEERLENFKIKEVREIINRILSQVLDTFKDLFLALNPKEKISPVNKSLKKTLDILLLEGVDDLIDLWKTTTTETKKTTSLRDRYKRIIAARS